MGRLFRRLRFFSRNSKTEASDITRLSQADRCFSRSPALPLGRRRYGYNGRSTPMGDRACCSAETEAFIEQISAASLSHFLIWYIHNDVVPPSDLSHRGEQKLNVNNLTGWIRLGYELRNATAINGERQQPKQLLAIIQALHLEEEQVMGKLLRLSDVEQMRSHELGEDKIENISSWIAAGEKLDADRRMLEKLQPISKTMAAQCQLIALDWVNTFLDCVIRPRIDGTGFQRHSFWPLNQDEDRQRFEQFFRDICGRHICVLESKIYEEALKGAGWNQANQIVAMRTAMLSDSERSWFARHRHIEYSTLPDRSLRRRSAPLFHDRNDLIESREQILVIRESHDDVFRLAMQEHLDPVASMQTTSARFSKGKKRLHDEPTSQEMMYTNTENNPPTPKQALVQGARDVPLARTGSHGSTNLKKHCSNPDLPSDALLADLERLPARPVNGSSLKVPREAKTVYRNDSGPAPRGATVSVRHFQGKSQDHSSFNKQVTFDDPQKRLHQRQTLRIPPRAQDRATKQSACIATASVSKSPVRPSRPVQNTTVNRPSATSASLSKSSAGLSRMLQNTDANHSTATSSSANRQLDDDQVPTRSSPAMTDDLGKSGSMWKEYDESQG